MTTPRYRFSASRVQRSVRRMDVFFSCDDREEYLDLLSQSASKHALDFSAWCLMSNHAYFVVMPVGRDRSTRTFGEAHRRYTRMMNSAKVGGVICGRSASILIRWTNGKV
jgi:REP element-mobilizing transposase RayT